MIDVPGLVKTVVTGPVDNMSVVDISSSMYIKAHFAGVELDVLSVLVQPLDLLSNLSSEWSDDNHNSSGQSSSVSS